MTKTLTLLTALLVYTSLLAQKQVAITFDDLPLGGGGGHITLDKMVRINEQIIQTCLEYEVPAIGFVNEEKLIHPGEMDTRAGILQSWLEADLELGNHTFSHPSFYKTPLRDFQEDVLKGEVITRKLTRSHGKELCYFRHPYLNTGPDSTTRARFEVFLKDHGYDVAPVTVESSDYIFNKVYIDAMVAGDSVLMKKTGEAYVAHTLTMFEFAEEAALEITGRPVAHVFLCHANALNATYIEAIYKGLTKRGYQFIPLKKALEDPAYQLKDHYIGPWGISWLYRWDKNDPRSWLQTEPAVPEEILTRYRN